MILKKKTKDKSEYTPQRFVCLKIHGFTHDLKSRSVSAQVYPNALKSVGEENRVFIRWRTKGCPFTSSER
jgi:hypothetical protein